MNEIKYEPLYGLQKPFDNGPADSTAYGLFRDGYEYIYYKIDKTSVYCFDTDNQWSHIDGAPTIPFLAMRRIIRTPTWTVADQKAGRLPEVGCRVLYARNGLNGEIVSIDDSDDDDVELCLRFKDKSLLVCKMNLVKPIESPEEKAARLRDEWVEKAVGATPVYEIATHGYSTQLRIDISSIYDAMISGDLPVPVKGE